MPIYEYKCKKCGTHLEKRQSVSDAPLTVCENCGGELEKQVSLSGFQFKGAGWYVTDYAAKKSPGAEKNGEKPASAEKTEKSSSDTSTASSDSASNSKSDAPAAPKTDTTTAKKD
jgi:putative FmdB family regulatory protein